VLQLLASSIYVQAALVHIPDTCTDTYGVQYLWKTVIQSLGMKVCSPSELISIPTQFQWSKLVSNVEHSIPGHMLGMQNCISTVFDVFFNDMQNVAKHFQLQIEDMVFCTCCNFAETRTHAHTVLPVCIKSGMTMQDAVYHCMRTTQIKQHRCSACGACRSRHRMFLRSAGNVLLVHVSKGAAVQIREPLASIQIGLNHGNRYELRGVIGYNGDGKAGHYWNYVRTEGKNQVISDAQSRLGTSKDIESIAGSGVMFLYEKLESDEFNQIKFWSEVRYPHSLMSHFL
jgi:ubiquitin C-terminal hydrolase